MRLELLGFQQVYRYQPGKQDWWAMGWPMEGARLQRAFASDVLNADVPTCAIDEKIGAVRERIQSSGWQTCVVVSEERVILGRLREQAWSADAGVRVEQVMEPDPTSYRPNRYLDEVVERMQEQKVDTLLISNCDGVLMGVLFRKDGERYLKQASSHS